MKKIGILTFAKYYNYGTALQAFALQEYLNQNFDVSAELIDYKAKNTYVGSKLIFTRIKRVFTYIKNFSKYYTLYQNRGIFAQKNRDFDLFFANKMAFSAKNADDFESLAEICKGYDAVMVGSDQTWNPFVAHQGQFLLEYLNGKKISKMAYAPSIGISKIPEEKKDRYQKALSDFSYLSCRERSGAAFLSELLGRKVEFVIDPTLLLNAEDWLKIASSKEEKKPYLLTYFLGDNPRHRKAAEKIAAEKGLEIVALPISYLEIKNSGIQKRYVGPDGFLSLIAGASFVCTDSFHGTMFSINFGKDFVSFPKRDDVDLNSDNNRLYDALSVFGLEDRLGIGNQISRDSIDYSQVKEKLASLRAHSKKYLAEAIESLSREEL